MSPLPFGDSMPEPRFNMGRRDSRCRSLFSKDTVSPSHRLLLMSRCCPGGCRSHLRCVRLLPQRHVDFPIPAEPNFRDYYVQFKLDESKFRPGHQVERYPKPGTFSGFARPGGRGVGTRNYIAILGTSSRTASYARALAERF